MIFASHHLSTCHALSLRLQSWLELIDLAFLLPPPSLLPSSQMRRSRIYCPPQAICTKAVRITELEGAIKTTSVHGGETKAQQVPVSCPRSSGNWVAELRLRFLVSNTSFPSYSTTPDLILPWRKRVCMEPVNAFLKQSFLAVGCSGKMAILGIR